jgi:hypothetical protein
MHLFFIIYFILYLLIFHFLEDFLQAAYCRGHFSPSLVFTLRSGACLGNCGLNSWQQGFTSLHLHLQQKQTHASKSFEKKIKKIKQVFLLIICQGFRCNNTTKHGTIIRFLQSHELGPPLPPGSKHSRTRTCTESRQTKREGVGEPLWLFQLRWGRGCLDTSNTTAKKSRPLG